MLALVAVSAAGASAAARFEYSAGGTFSSAQTSNQVFKPSTTKKEQFSCEKAQGTFVLTELAFTEQQWTAEYSGCKAENIPLFGNLKAGNVKTSYTLHANGTVELSEMVFEVPALGCATTVQPHAGPVSYENAGVGFVENSAVASMVSSGGGVCPSGTTGTFNGSSFVQRVGGGTVHWIP
ncbi:MAG TPA: hypothetical protein VGI17_09085 [Solirubrobacterales bacterium]|jgi:hypothetical protein